MKPIQTLHEFSSVLSALLADKPKGTVGRLPDGDLVWVLDGQVIGCWEGADIDDAFQWDQSALDDATLEEINEWAAAPVFEHHVPDADFDGDLSLSPFRQ
ncbi:hypothetical protein QU487_06405 [Crenobacter sp. SG2305]|uniref:hypothetical protein n=1 Tax=Crenobacter oryzisoli TaxID=3056844 RepID=UPI0025AB518E|nr:hypothetical protein [Crenobacter sp. SG2305]MDN0082384.1 hypothetical protein [Crenobacter sp. SG2305]